MDQATKSLTLLDKSKRLFHRLRRLQLPGRNHSHRCKRSHHPASLNEREQELHATKLAYLNILRIANLETILSKNLNSLLEMCLKEPYPHNQNRTIATTGAQQSARLIEELIA